uniref:Uncharacterized protein n=1 Tax=Trichuris muris TaxID=70415 RepID=A0A5S6QVH0_TRIMR
MGSMGRDTLYLTNRLRESYFALNIHLRVITFFPEANAQLFLSSSGGLVISSHDDGSFTGATTRLFVFRRILLFFNSRCLPQH